MLEWARRIIGDTRAMRQEVQALKHGLTGRLRLAAIPATLAMIETLTTPYRERHPAVQFTILSRNSKEILQLLDNLEIDAGVTYLDNEPLGRVAHVPLYREHYCLLTAADAPLGNRDKVTWAEVARVPLCLLTANTQTRRIIDDLVRQAGGDAQPTLESDFNGAALLSCAYRTLGERHAGADGRNPWSRRRSSRDTDRRAGGQPYGGLGDCRARTDDAADRGPRRRGAPRSADLIACRRAVAFSQRAHDVIFLSNDR